MTDRPLRVLVAHNLYRSEMPSGENAVVRDEIEQLRGEGVEVIPFLRSSDEIASMRLREKLGVATGPIYNPWTVRDFKQVLQRERPDVVHVHNVFPLLSPWIVRESKKSGIPVVQTAHNYRHTCVKGTHYRDEKVCTDCLGRRIPVPAIRHSCYRDSRPQSVSMVLGQMAGRSTWNLVDRYLALTPFMAERMIGQGVPADRITLRPTSAPDPGQTKAPHRTVLFVGRLDPAKGVDTLLKAWVASQASIDGWQLRIAGNGPLVDEVLAIARHDSSVVALGSLGHDDLRLAYEQAAAVLVPSAWYEGYPRVVAEAFAHGRPVIASRIGSLATICRFPYAMTAEPTPSSWRAALDGLTGLDLAAMGAAARAHWEKTLTPAASLETLLDAYRTVQAGPRAC